MFPNSTKIYNVYIKKSDINPVETAEFIEEGFSLYALIFGVFWGIVNRVPLFIFLAIIVQTITSLLVYNNQLDLISIYIIQITSNIILAFEANNLRCASLRRKKYVFCDIVVGRNLLEAQQRFFDRYLDNQTVQGNGNKENISDNIPVANKDEIPKDVVTI